MNLSNMIKIILIVILLFTTYSLSYIYIYSENLDYRYSLTITNDDNDEYTIQIPYPIIPHKIVKNDNVLDININDSINGKYYEITGINQIEIEFHTTKTFTVFHPLPDKYYQLSSQDELFYNDTSYDRYNRILVFSDTNVSFELDVFIEIIRHGHEYGGSQRSYNYEGETSEGWNEIDIEVGMGDVDDFFSLPCLAILNVTLTFIMIVISIKLIKRRNKIERD